MTLQQRKLTSSSVDTAPAEQRGPITRRSVLLGLILVVVISLLPPYSDWIRDNTFLIGNHLPLVVIATLTLLCVVLNPLLDLPRLKHPLARTAAWLLLAATAYAFVGFVLRVGAALLVPGLDALWLPTVFVTMRHNGVWVALACVAALLVNPLFRSRRLATSEMAVAIGMMLIACALTSSGFFRFFHPQIAATVHHGNSIAWYREYLSVLPDWMFPSRNGQDKIIEYFYMSIRPGAEMTVWDTFAHWAKPYAAWAFFILPAFFAVLFLCAIFRKQWVVHERLAFPLAAIPMEMMAEPALGKRLNPLWTSKLLWIGASIPFIVHLLNGLALFNPSIPTIDVAYDLNKAFTEYPWNQLPGELKANQIYFSVIGVTYFVPLEIAFSIWFFTVAYSGGSIAVKRAGTDVSADHWSYQNLGMCFTYGLIILGIARHHIRHVLKNLFTRREDDEFLPYGVSVFGLLFCMLVACGFLWAAGMSWYLAPLTFLWLMFWSMIVTRVVIEAGVLCVQMPAAFEPMRMMGLVHMGITNTVNAVFPNAITPDRITWMRNWTLASFSLRMSVFDQREILMPFAANAMRIGGEIRSRVRVKFFLLLSLALVLTLLLAGTMHHVLSYEYGRDKFDTGHYGHKIYPTATMDQAREWADPGSKPVKLDRGLNFLYGSVSVAVVSTLRAIIPNSPLHPIGLITLNGWATRKIWFSIFLAWAIKWIILRYGGARVFQEARPFFIGLLVGESLAGMLWVIVGLLTSWPDPSKPYQLLPA